MITRPFWIKQIEDCWKKVPIAWLSGVRRVGKTTLARSLKNALYMNCDLPSVQELLADPEAFYRSIEKPVVIFDEVHQLPDPSRLLKIGADVYPSLKILATGSSTLAATRKFRDSLAGRKRNIHLVPILHCELAAFGVNDLNRRLWRGGLPPALLAEEKDAGFYSEWLDSYYARDVQELFRVEKRAGFLKLVESVLRLSGGQMEIVTLANLSGLSRPTVMSYLDVLELTHVAVRLSPYSGGGTRELVRQPKIYGFDTGFVAYAKGWGELRQEDRGLLWEHLALESLLTRPLATKLMYWRDKDGHELDFVIPRGRAGVDVIECKWNAAHFDSKNLQIFRSLHPNGKNIVLTPHIPIPYTRKIGGLQVAFTGLEQLEL